MKKAKTIAFGSWLIFALSILWTNPVTGVLGLIGFLGFGGSIVYMMFIVTCPKCQARLGQTALQSKNMRYCPECGIDFSESKP